MIVEVANLTPWERSIPTPANVSIPIKASESVIFEYPKAWSWFFENLEDGAYNFGVEMTTTPDEVTPTHPELDFSSLDEAISKANELKISTKVSRDGNDVYTIYKWVTQDTKLRLEKALSEALLAKEKAASDDDVAAAVSALTNDIADFESNQKDGKVIYFGYLGDIITEARKSIEGITESEDGFDVDPETQWCTPEEMSTFKAAIESAQKVFEEGSDQESVDSETDSLTSALETFEEAISDGKMILPVIHDIGKPTSACMSKKIKDLIGENFNITCDEDNNLKVHGDIINITDFDAYTEENELTDWFAPVFIYTDKGAVIKSTTLNGKDKTITVDDPDGQVVVIFAIKKDDPTGRTFKIYGSAEQAEADKNGEEYKIDASDAVFFVTPSITAVKVAGQTQSWKGVTYSSLMSPDIAAALDGNTINVTGTLYRYNGWEAFPEALQNKNYLVLNIEVPNTGIATKAISMNGDTKKYTFTDKTNEDFVIPFDGNHKTHDIAFYMDEDHRDNDTDGVTYTVDCTGATLETHTKEELEEIENPTPVPAVSAPLASQMFYGKRADELQTGIQVGEDSISGDLKYIEDYSEMFPSNPELQSGNYLALNFQVTPVNSKIEVELQGGTTTMKGLVEVTDGYCVFRITDPSTQKVHAVFTNSKGTKSVEKTYTLTELVLDDKPAEVKSVQIAGQQQAFKGVTYSDLMSSDTQAQLDGKNINITGTLYKFTGDQLGTNAKDKNCVVVNITVDREGVVVTRTDNPAFSYTYTGKTSDDFIIPLTSDHNTCELVFYPDADHKESQTSGTTYTVNASGATFETRTKAEITAPLLTSVEIPQQTESWQGAKYSDLMSPDTSATLKGNKIEVTGTLYKYDNWKAFGESLQNKNYLVVTLVSKEGVKLDFKKIDNRDSTYTYPGGDPEFDLAIALDEGHKTIDLTFYPTEAGERAKRYGQVYTLDCTNVTLSTQTKEQASAAAAASVQADGPSMINLNDLSADQLKGIAKELNISTTARKAETLIKKIEDANPNEDDLYDAYVNVVGE